MDEPPLGDILTRHFHLGPGNVHTGNLMKPGDLDVRRVAGPAAQVKNRIELYVPGDLANTLTPDSMDLRQYSRNELVVSLLARCPAGPAGNIGRSHLMDRRGDGVPIIIDESYELSGRRPEYEVIDDSELRLIIWAACEETGSGMSRMSLER